MLISRAAAEKLPLRATRTKSCMETNRSFIRESYLRKSNFQTTAISWIGQSSFKNETVEANSGRRIEHAHPIYHRRRGVGVDIRHCPARRQPRRPRRQVGNERPVTVRGQ